MGIVCYMFDYFLCLFPTRTATHVFWPCPTLKSSCVCVFTVVSVPPARMPLT